jgi:hypothetical protein
MFYDLVACPRERHLELCTRSEPRDDCLGLENAARMLVWGR